MRSDARANRDRILAAAEEAFGQLGADLSTEEVARRAGVGVATVFRHFPTKRDLLEAALVRHFAELDRRVVAAESATAAADAVRALITEMVTGGSTGVKVALIGELTTGGEGLGGEAAEASLRVRRRFAALLGRAQAEGGIRADIDLDVLYHLVRALGEQASASTGASARAARAALEVVLEGLRARG